MRQRVKLKSRLVAALGFVFLAVVLADSSSVRGAPDKDGWSTSVERSDPNQVRTADAEKKALDVLRRSDARKTPSGTAKSSERKDQAEAKVPEVIKQAPAPTAEGATAAQGTATPEASAETAQTKSRADRLPEANAVDGSSKPESVRSKSGEAGSAPAPASDDAKTATPPVPAAPSGDAKAAQSDSVPDSSGRKSTSYCVNIANPAIDARYRLQKEELEALRADIQKRTAGLQTKIAEMKDWFARREAFVEKAQDNLVGIYAGMKPDAAARQLSELDEETSSALLAKIDARQSSAILSEMEAKKAAQLTSIMAGVGSVGSESERSAVEAKEDEDQASPPNEEGRRD